MAKHQKKIERALNARRAAVPVAVAKFHFRVPGSQNRKKGY